VKGLTQAIRWYGALSLPFKVPLRGGWFNHRRFLAICPLTIRLRVVMIWFLLCAVEA
jgi:hypothetical protein